MDVAEQRLIDANALEIILKSQADVVALCERPEIAGGFLQALDFVKKAPTVDAAPVVHGQWVCDTFFDEPVMRCTACKRGFSLGHRAERFPYCPNCGAKMDGGASDA